MNEIRYVTREGAHGSANFLPDGCIQIAEDVYQLLEDNPDLTNVEIRDDQVFITMSLKSYIDKALEVIRGEVSKYLPDAENLNHLFMCLTLSIIPVDNVLGQLTPPQAKMHIQAQLMQKNHLLLTSQKYEVGIKGASSAEEVDMLLDDFLKELALREVIT